MKLLLDMDGVLCDFYSGVCKRFNRVSWPYQWKPNVWNWFQEWGITESDLAPHMDQQFYANLDWMPDGQQILTLAENKAPGNVFLLTSPWDTPGCMEGKRDWVCKHIPQYLHRLVIGSPKQLLSRPDAVLLDDSESNCRKFASVDAPGTAVLVPRPWNVRHDECCFQTGRILDLDGLFHGYTDGRGKYLDEFLAKKAMKG